MRDAFFRELAELYREDERVVFITGDLGYKLFDPLREIDPARMINFGIREAGMIGFAAGLARSGMLPYVYSITPFITLRCLEQIKIDVCYNNNRVVITGVGGGFSYGANGPTHHGIDDLGVLSVLPNLRLWTPADPVETCSCVRAAAALDGPSYLRLGRNGEATLHDRAQGLPPVDTPVIVREGSSGVIISCGVILHEVLAAADALREKGVDIRVIHLPVFRPFPREALRGLLLDRKPVLTVEEHVAAGGLGAETAIMFAETNLTNPFKILCSPTTFPNACLSRKAALAWAGIDAETISARFSELTART
jgi:transketolase